LTKFRESIKISSNISKARQMLLPLPKEKTMFQVSGKAGEKLQEFLKNVEEVHPVRLMMTEGG